MSTAEIIRLDGITFRYKKRLLLDGIHLCINAGECVGLLGENGSGKSTLLSILAGVRSPQKGTCLYRGENIWKNKKKLADCIGYLPQEDPLLEELSVADNLRLWYGSALKNDPPLLSLLKLTGLGRRRVSTLSGGEKRRLAIACALSKKQNVLLLDEPSSSLDLHQKSLIRDFITAYTGEGNTLLISTHDPLEIGLCTRTAMLENGHLDYVEKEAALARLEGRQKELERR